MLRPVPIQTTYPLDRMADALAELNIGAHPRKDFVGMPLMGP